MEYKNIDMHNYPGIWKNFLLLTNKKINLLQQKETRKHNTNSSSFDNRTENVSVVEIRNLSITFGNKTSFEMLDRSIRQIFNSKHQFRAHNVGVGRAMNQNSSVISL